MNHTSILATEHSVVFAERDRSGWREIRRGLIDQYVTSVIAREGVILAGTRNGVFRSDDVGRSWREASAGLKHKHVRWLAYHPAISDREFAGTEPAGLFVSHNGAQTWQQLAEGSDGNPALNGLPAACVYPDVHSIVVHPSSPDLVFAPTSGGFYRSVDGGRTWALLYDGNCRAAWIDPVDAQHMLLGPADGVGRNGRIEETRDGGQTWQNAGAELRAPWPQHIIERFFQIDDEVWAVLSNGEVLAVSFDTHPWRPVLQDVKSINAITTFPIA